MCMSAAAPYIHKLTILVSIAYIRCTLDILDIEVLHIIYNGMYMHPLNKP